MLATLIFVESAVADKRGEGRGLRDIEPGKTVEKTSAENVSAKESPPGPEQCLDQGPLASFFDLTIQEIVTEHGDFLHMAIERGIGVMVNVSS
jgi:hypothetical protein